jgi:hypothetical protein
VDPTAVGTPGQTGRWRCGPGVVEEARHGLGDVEEGIGKFGNLTASK